MCRGGCSNDDVGSPPEVTVVLWELEPVPPWVSGVDVVAGDVAQRDELYTDECSELLADGC